MNRISAIVTATGTAATLALVGGCGPVTEGIGRTIGGATTPVAVNPTARVMPESDNPIQVEAGVETVVDTVVETVIITAEPQEPVSVPAPAEPAPAVPAPVPATQPTPLPATGGSASTYQCTMTIWSTDGYTNVRTGPGTRYGVKGILHNGDVVWPGRYTPS